MTVEKVAEKLHAAGWQVEPHGHGFRCTNDEKGKSGFLYFDQTRKEVMFMPDGGISGTPLSWEELCSL